MANHPSHAAQVPVVSAEFDRSTQRIGVHRETIGKLSLTWATAAPLDEALRDLSRSCTEVDELWTFVGKKQRHVTERDDTARVATYEDMSRSNRRPSTFLASSLEVRRRDINYLIEDVASRSSARIQISIDGQRLCVNATARLFDRNVADAQRVKLYEAEAAGP